MNTLAFPMSGPGPAGEDMAELSFLLPGRQALALEEAAQARGLTPAQVIRRLIRDFCANSMLG